MTGISSLELAGQDPATATNVSDRYADTSFVLTGVDNDFARKFILFDWLADGDLLLQLMERPR